ncbi:SRPBCC family protein [Prescottella soli]|uniref:SRPBCC family protein n=1 Tax=Prescottella soli TaxID=1543852 RepID=A0ABW9FR36_9NOCA
MSTRSVTHSTFVVERVYDAPPARVFHAFADPEAKARWFSHPDEWVSNEGVMDFRVGGRESISGGPKSGPVHSFSSIYQDIVPNERIVYSYDMHMDDVRISVSLATIEFFPAGAGTRLVMTEQGAFLDGHDDAGSREAGTNLLLDALGAALAAESASA